VRTENEVIEVLDSDDPDGEEGDKSGPEEGGDEGDEEMSTSHKENKTRNNDSRAEKFNSVSLPHKPTFQDLTRLFSDESRENIRSERHHGNNTTMAWTKIKTVAVMN
jgi:hypothetical protein